jgi:MFS family permease
MRNSQNVETRRDRKALARHAGMGKISIISVLAGALCALAVVEILVTIAGAIAVAINGGTNFSALGDKGFKTIAGLVLVVATFGAFVVGGYVSGRMSRRSGASHGLLAGVAGVVLAALAGWVVVGTGTDAGLSAVARHIHVADSWHQWRNFGLLAVVVIAAAMVLAGLAGGVEGERWQGKLLSRAVDPTYGPESVERAQAHKSITEAEVARLAAAGRVGRVTGTAKAAALTAPSQAERERVATPVAATATGGDRTLVTPSSPVRSEPVGTRDEPTGTDNGAVDGGTVDADTKLVERRHLLGRR